jgi:hypothetical protein
MIRGAIIEQATRLVYGSAASDDVKTSDQLFNVWINQGIALAAKKNFGENLAIDALQYVNGSFYTTYTGLAIKKFQPFVYQITLPDLPVGIGANMGISTLQVMATGGNGVPAMTALPLSQNQIGFVDMLRPVPNKITYWSEGIFAYVKSVVPLYNGYTAIVRMISGGDSEDFDSVVNVPPDYLPMIIEYVARNLSLERSNLKEAVNDGETQ